MKNKNTFRFIYLLCFLYINSYSQYKKFSLNNMAYWREQFVESVPGGMNMQEYQYGIKNDTIINFKPYNQVYVSYIGPLFQQGNGSGPYFPNLSFIRQDTILRKIFILNSQNQEFVLFNFNKNIGDTLNVYDIVSGIKTLTVSIRDSLILSDGLYHTRFKYAPNNITVIEGVGGEWGFLTPYTNGFPKAVMLECNGKIPPNPQLIYSLNNSCYSFVTNIRNPAFDKEYKIYPNPSKNKINISIPEYDLRNNSVEIRNLSSQLLYSEKMELINNEIDISLLTNGIYFLKIETSSDLTTYKIIKE